MRWSAVVGYESLYEINANGDVRSLHKRNFHQLLSQRVDRGGYVTVRLSKNSKNSTLYVHRLVATAFIENPDNKCFVNHIDGDRLNNKKENLEWVSHSENVLHAYEMGLIKKKTRPVIDTCQGLEFESCKKAALNYGIRYNTLRGYLNGQIKNPTSLQYKSAAA